MKRFSCWFLALSFVPVGRLGGRTAAGDSPTGPHRPGRSRAGRQYCARNGGQKRLRRRRHPGRPPWQSRRFQGGRHGGHCHVPPDEDRHDRPHLFDDQADHDRRRHDSVGGEQAASRRSRVKVHSRNEEPPRLRRAERRNGPRAEGNHHPRPDAAHGRFYVWSLQRYAGRPHVPRAETPLPQRAADGILSPASPRSPCSTSRARSSITASRSTCLGRVVEVASGETLDVFFEKRIFKPLDMVDTAFYVPASKVDRFAANYGPGLVMIDDPAKSPYLKPPKFLSGGGGLVSTARDYARFCQMMLNDGVLEGSAPSEVGDGAHDDPQSTPRARPDANAGRGPDPTKASASDWALPCR